MHASRLRLQRFKTRNTRWTLPTWNCCTTHACILRLQSGARQRLDRCPPRAVYNRTQPAAPCGSRARPAAPRAAAAVGGPIVGPEARGWGGRVPVGGRVRCPLSAFRVDLECAPGTHRATQTHATAGAWAYVRARVRGVGVRVGGRGAAHGGTQPGAGPNRASPRPGVRVRVRVCASARRVRGGFEGRGARARGSHILLSKSASAPTPHPRAAPRPTRTRTRHAHETRRA